MDAIPSIIDYGVTKFQTLQAFRYYESCQVFELLSKVRELRRFPSIVSGGLLTVVGIDVEI